MPIPKMDIALNDFSGGELNSDAKRMNGALAQTGARVMSNMRILNTRKMKNRPGRRAFLLESGRVEKVKMSPGNYFYLVFGPHYLRVYNAAGTQVFNSPVRGDGVSQIPWGPSDYVGITFAIHRLSIYIAYAAGSPNNVPQVLTWDGASQTSTWTLSTYAETITAGGQKETVFYRISPPNITMTPSGQTGLVNITFSGDVLQAGMVGARMTYCGRQITIASVTDARHGTANVNEQLFGSELLPFGSDPTGVFNIGDEVAGSVSNAKGIVIAVNGAGKTIDVQLIPPNFSFATTDTVVGPGGSLAMIGGATAAGPGGVSVWEDEVMNTFRGYPSSVFVDQSRLGFCNFPGLPNGIGWSAIDQPEDFYVDGTTSAAIFELAPNKSQVLYVVPGAEGAEMVFCDNRVYYIPISVSNPLKPGSVSFNQIAGDGCYPVQPRAAGTAMLFLAAGGLRVSAIVVVGLATRPFDVADLTEFHAHLLKSPVAIAVPSADGTFSERYAYVLNSDGTVAVGKYSLDEYGRLDGTIGWLPWTGAGTVSWVSALDAEVDFVTSYAPNGIAPVSLVEVLDDTLYLDAAMFANAIPATLTPPAGKGPFWWIAGGSVDLMDQTYRPMGTYQIDGNGNIVAQGNGGEDLAAASLYGGQAWSATWEPFIPQAPQGQDSKQRMRRRKVVRAAISVQNSSGFTFDGQRVPAYFQDDDATKPPPLREDTFQFRPRGLAYDPRKQLIKDTPGPLIITEAAIEATV